MSRVRRWLILWFGFDQPVEPRTYLAHGVGLLALKYGVDVLLVWLVLHRLWMPLDYVNPALSLRFGTNTIPVGLLFQPRAGTLPFPLNGRRRALAGGVGPLALSVPLPAFHLPERELGRYGVPDLRPTAAGPGGGRH